MKYTNLESQPSSPKSTWNLDTGMLSLTRSPTSWPHSRPDLDDIAGWGCPSVWMCRQKLILHRSIKESLEGLNGVICIADDIILHGTDESSEFQQFAQGWNFEHQTSSSGDSQSNESAEAAVKSAKRVLRKCLKKSWRSLHRTLEPQEHAYWRPQNEPSTTTHGTKDLHTSPNECCCPEAREAAWWKTCHGGEEIEDCRVSSPQTHSQALRCWWSSKSSTT